MKKGIVIVSHVNEIAVGIKKLVDEVTQEVCVTIAGGLEDNSIGTSVERIMAAIEENEAEEVLAFYDLGSAKMNLELVMEMIDKKVYLYDVAVLEGTYTAAVLLQAGAELSTIEEQLLPLKIK